MATGTVLAVTGIVLSVVGAGVGAYAQHQQGKAQSAIASFNAQQQEVAAKQQLMSLQTQAALAKRDAEANLLLREAEANARINNAEAMEQTALMQDSVNRMNLQKRREEYGRLQATQRAAIAASGVTEATGTPLDLIAETAGKIQADLEEQHHVGETQRRTLFSEARMERLGGKLAMAGATLDRDSAVTAAALREAAGKGEFLGNMRQAEITRLSGAAAKTAGTYQAGATLLSGLGDAVTGIAPYAKPKPKTPTFKIS